MSEIWILFLVLGSSIFVGIIMGVVQINIEKRSPEIFSPKLENNDVDFSEVSQNLELVNKISDEELTYEHFTQSRWL